VDSRRDGPKTNTRAIATREERVREVWSTQRGWQRTADGDVGVRMGGLAAIAVAGHRGEREREWRRRERANLKGDFGNTAPLNFVRPHSHLRQSITGATRHRRCDRARSPSLLPEETSALVSRTRHWQDLREMGYVSTRTVHTTRNENQKRCDCTRRPGDRRG
jgi:hypothetical protein